VLHRCVLRRQRRGARQRRDRRRELTGLQPRTAQLEPGGGIAGVGRHHRLQDLDRLGVPSQPHQTAPVGHAVATRGAPVGGAVELQRARQPAQRLGRLRQGFVDPRRIGVGGAQRLQHVPSRLVAVRGVEGAGEEEAGVRLGGVETAGTRERGRGRRVLPLRRLRRAQRLPPVRVAGLRRHRALQRRRRLTVALRGKRPRAGAEVPRPRRGQLQQHGQGDEKHGVL